MRHRRLALALAHFCYIPPMPRTFIAVNLPPLRPLMQALGELRQMGRAVRAVAPENLHLTLRFLGEVDGALQHSIAEALRAAASATARFDLKLQGVGVFPSEQRPAVVWAGADEQSAAPLQQVAEQLDAQLTTLGLPADAKPFHPHLTLARIKARPPAALRGFLDNYHAHDFGSVRVKSIDLMISSLQPHGPQYSLLQAIELQG